MYTPPAYDTADPELQLQLMKEWSFATLFSQTDGMPTATHLPILAGRGGKHGKGVLRTHMARANPQWKAFEAGARALVVFAGPQAYVPVNWYEDDQTFPTWNYGAVHATGTVTLEHDPGVLRVLLQDTIATFDTPPEGPWRMENVDPAKTNRLLRGIVGLRIELESVEAKLKFNQDKSATDRAQVAARLMDNPATAAAGAFMQRLDRQTEPAD
ncbi:FMN-binding negative transcriptional regulator [Chachezhania antarctica]|uniref:FMN-binding negative transcriptional regulator n=1 Tax=Chachezhania antarctica TaxID=2340860 RepID=UPI000EB21141|nr:FMN-binding negative transcriptional regulator [Chachezhania antarctica]|tara:strand:+ start:6259 stop:6897 length:639 start_codon:yes stop_codon:yes gene_type:complete